MNPQKIEKFSIIGISVRTTNENGQASIDIPALWHRFMTQKIAEQIPQKMDNAIYCIYTEYEKDHTKPYTTVLGCKVQNLDNIPEGFIGKTFEETTYTKRIAKGNLLKGMVFEEWVKIWNDTNLNRTFIADIEVYGEKSQKPENAEVDIFLSIE